MRMRKALIVIGAIVGAWLTASLILAGVYLVVDVPYYLADAVGNDVPGKIAAYDSFQLLSVVVVTIPFAVIFYRRFDGRWGAGRTAPPPPGPRWNDPGAT